MYVLTADARTLGECRIHDRTCLRLVHSDRNNGDDGDDGSDGNEISHTNESETLTPAVPTVNTRLQKCETLLMSLEKAKETNKIKKARDLKLFRANIVRAMGLSRGHWYKCKCGYVYCIADCGGANQTSSCPQCKGRIGGNNHRLAEGNTSAPEMVSGSNTTDYPWVGTDGR